MLTTLKWASDDSESDDKQKTSTSSLSGSENDGDEISKCVEMDLAIDACVLVHPDS